MIIRKRITKGSKKACLKQYELLTKGLNPLNDAKIIRIQDETDQMLELMCSLADCGRSAIVDVALRFMAEKFANSDSELLNMIADIKQNMEFKDKVIDTFEKVQNEQCKS